MEDSCQELLDAEDNRCSASLQGDISDIHIISTIKRRVSNG